MSTAAQRLTGQGGNGNGPVRELEEWRDHARVSLQPVAAPSILGLYGFAAAPFIVTAHLVGWYGTATSPLLIFPFATAAGGIAQSVAALWAYRARDGLATAAIHGIWAAFWVGYGFLNFMVALKLVVAPAPGRRGAGVRLLVLCRGGHDRRGSDGLAGREPGAVGSSHSVRRLGRRCSVCIAPSVAPAGRSLVAM